MYVEDSRKEYKMTLKEVLNALKPGDKVQLGMQTNIEEFVIVSCNQNEINLEGISLRIDIRNARNSVFASFEINNISSIFNRIPRMIMFPNFHKIYEIRHLYPFESESLI